MQRFLQHVANMPYGLFHGIFDDELVVEDAVSQPCRTFDPLSEEELLRLIDRSNERCPFHGRIGQDTVIEQLLAALVSALGDRYHRIDPDRGNAMMFTGPASVGKTDFAKRLAGPNGLNIPFVQTEAKSITNVSKIFDIAKAAADEAGYALIELGVNGGRIEYQFPPMTFFIDEMHGLSPAVMDAMLTATEPNDATLMIPGAVVDCRNMLWIGATTERGEIMIKNPALDSRFEKIEFHHYTHREVSEIIKMNFGWPIDACSALATRSGGVIREALAIGRKAQRQLDYMQLTDKNATLLDAIDKVGEQLGIDKTGMSNMQLLVLKSLFDVSPNGMTYTHLARVISRTVEELKTVVLPSLLMNTEDHPARAEWSNKTYITDVGVEELLKREIITEQQAKTWAATMSL